MKKYFLIALLALVIYACKKEGRPPDMILGEDVVLAEVVFIDVFKLADNFIQKAEDDLFGNDKGISGVLYTGCASVSISPFDTLTWPKDIIADFGDTNCFGTDGRYRRGRVHININQQYQDSLSLATVTFDNYYFNDNKVNGVLLIENLGKNADGMQQYKLNLNDALLITAGGTVFYGFERVLVKTMGHDTPWPALEDDLFAVTGTTTGKISSAYPFQADIIVPVLLSHACPWLFGGVLEVVPEGLDVTTIDFGSGVCDKLVVVTANAETRTIEMP